MRRALLNIALWGSAPPNCPSHYFATPAHKPSRPHPLPTAPFRLRRLQCVGKLPELRSEGGQILLTPLLADSLKERPHPLRPRVGREWPALPLAGLPGHGG